MSGDIDRKVKSWESGNQEVSESDIKAALKRYFPDFCIHQGGSHRYVISHRFLKDEPNFAPNGTFLIPVKGNKVKHRYAKILAKAIRIIKEKEKEK